MGNLSSVIFERLTVPGSRLEWLRDWLLGQVWASDRYASLSPLQFLEQGERVVNELEEVIAAAAPRLYDELLSAAPRERNVRSFLDERQPCAVVIFDGLSLREIPVLLRLASASRLKLSEPIDFSFAAVPSETVDFIEQRLGIGCIAPSQLPSRASLREAGIAAYYYDSITRRHILDASASALLLWSSFPDQTYGDSGARFAQHFEQMHTLLETAWMNTVQQIPPSRTILVTSDHGYVYFGSGMNAPRSNSAVRPLTGYLGGERAKRISAAGEPPAHPDLLRMCERDLAIIRGRVQTHPPGAASNKLYKHGGLSLMEMLTPWIVLTSETP
jgi:hypothetical protein